MARKDALPMTYSEEGLTCPYVMEKFYEFTDIDIKIIFT